MAWWAQKGSSQHGMCLLWSLPSKGQLSLKDWDSPIHETGGRRFDQESCICAWWQRQLHKYTHICWLWQSLVYSLQDHSNNFGHSAIHEPLHIFIFSCENHIGNLRPGKFRLHILNNTLTLAITAVSLKLCCTIQLALGLTHSWRYNAFSMGTRWMANWNFLISKWHKYNDLILKLKQNEVYSEKLEQLCCEIAHTDMYVSCPKCFAWSSVLMSWY